MKMSGVSASTASAPDPVSAESAAQNLGLFSKLKALQRQLEFLSVQVRHGSSLGWMPSI